ncbi:hypothetical protein ROTO_34670 [Roseovarius tolerans]|uniref:Uncharacterized protein n=1 Tax=Roseovarius tolerans TaxID=74031 RepID=A0A0L6CQJ7_9RHOB|nr:hypothetical protein ROTO_34670 [Roseovarius tolerans]
MKTEAICDTNAQSPRLRTLKLSFCINRGLLPDPLNDAHLDEHLLEARIFGVWRLIFK